MTDVVPMNRVHFIAVSLFAVNFLLAACSPSASDTAAGNRPTGTIEAVSSEDQTFDVDALAQIELRNVRGDMSVKTGRPGQVTIETTRRARGKDASEARNRLGTISVKTENRAGAISVVGDAGGARGSRDAWNGKQVDVQIVAQESPQAGRGNVEMVDTTVDSGNLPS